MLKKLGEQLSKHPERVVRNRQEAYSYVASGCCMYTDVNSLTTAVDSFILDTRQQLMPYIRATVYKDYKKTGNCNFSLGKVNGGYGFMAIALKRNSPYTPAITLG